MRDAMTREGSGWLGRRLVLSPDGVRDFRRSVGAQILKDLVLMAPVGLLFVFIAQLLPAAAGFLWGVHAGQGPGTWALLGAIVVLLLALAGAEYLQYNASFLNTYKESAVRRLTLAEKLRTLPLAFFGKKDLSDLTSTLMADSTLLETAFSHWYPELAASVVSTLVVALALFAVDLRLAAAAIWVLPVSFVIVLLGRRAQRRVGGQEMRAKMDLAGGIQECIEAVRDLKANNAQGAYLGGLERAIAAVESRSMKTEYTAAAFVVTAQMVLRLGLATVAIVGAALLATGEVGLLTFLLFLFVVSRLYDPLSVSLQNLAAVIGSQVNLDRMRHLQDQPVQTGTTAFAPQGYDVEFRGVSFAYRSEGSEPRPVLHDVSFVARQGQVTALVGASGSGKSTVARLAARFWDADAGTILVGGVPVLTVDPETLLKAFSIVFQDVTLFNQTVLENIRIGRRGASDAEVLEAARAAQCDEFVAALPQGYQTPIGENGSLLSGGERQRISIARAILKDAPIVLLDEATASLDSVSETKVQAALSRLVQGKTVLLIAHRLRTVARADQIVVLDQGRVVEAGSPKDLLARGGFYARLAGRQGVGPA